MTTATPDITALLARARRTAARERYVKYWVSRTGRRPQDVYVPLNLRD